MLARKSLEARSAMTIPEIANSQIMINPQIVNPQISLVSLLKIANPHIFKEKNSVKDPDPHWFSYIWISVAEYR